MVLINSTHAPEALTRLTSLAIRYLKRDVEPPPKPSIAATRDQLAQYVGYYRDSSPRNAILAGVQFLRDGRTIGVEGDRLVLTPDFGPAMPLVAVNPGLFRRERDLDASLAFAAGEGGAPILTGPGIYAVRQPRWPIVAMRAGLAAAAIVALLAPVVALGRWVRDRRRGRGASAFAGLGAVWLAAATAVILALAVAAEASPIALGGVSWQSATVFAGSLAYPVLVAIGVLATAWGFRHAPRRWYAAWSAVVAVAHLAITVFLGWSGWLVFRSWIY